MSGSEEETVGVPPAPAAEPDRRRRPDHGLNRRYRRLMLVISLPLFLVVLTLAITQYLGQRRQILLELENISSTYALSLETIAKQANNHVLRMKSWSEGYLDSPPGEPHKLRQYLQPRFAGQGQRDGYTLDALPPDLRKRNGQLLLAYNAGVIPFKQVDQALAFFSVARLTHEVTPYFQWSYTFMADHSLVNLYPWINSRDLVEGQGLPDLIRGIRGYFDYELFTAGMPENNPKGTSYWTAPYIDAGGSGAMVSHAVPIYGKGRFQGIVGTDLRLAVLDQFLRKLPRSIGRLWIVDKDGFVLADSDGPIKTTLRKLDEALPEGLIPADIKLAEANRGKALEAGNRILIARGIRHAPWSLVYLVDNHEISSLLLPRFIPYGIIVSVLAGTFLLALYLLRREFINPALELVQYIQRASREPSAPEPSLPRLWQTWAHVVSRTFTAHRDANIKLMESEAFKSAIVENTLLAVVTMDEAGRIAEFNPAAEHMFGYVRSDAMGQIMADLIVPPSWRQAHRHGVARYLRTNQPHVLGTRMELTALRKHGDEFPVEISVSVIQMGQQRFFTAFISDLTEQKKAEEALRASEEQYRAIFNATSDALTLWNADGEVVDTNETHKRLCGFTLEEIRAMPRYEIIHPSSHDVFMEFQQRLARGEPYETEARVLCKDGRVLDVDVRSVPMLYQGKQHALVITRDITELKRTEDELARQRDALRQTEKLSAMGALLAGVAHELNNPLAILMGRASLLEEKSKDPAIKADALKIHAAADRCGRIVRTFLAMARQRPSRHESGKLNEVISAAVDLLGYGLRAAGIKVMLELEPGLPEVNMDSDQIGQLAVNLLVNAQQVLEAKTPFRQIRIQTYRDGENIHMRVADNGPGVPEEIRQLIFNPFFTTKAEGSGTGVGLSVCLGIAREHGGDLILEDSAVGASFLLRLPLSSQPGQAATAPVLLAVEENRGGHALIVDDEPEVASLLADILKSAGFTTHQAHSGQEALAWLDTHRCDFILSDIRMPDLDGPALWRSLKTSRPDLSRRMAFITGDILSASIAPFLKETGLPSLEKPFTPEDVFNLVARIESA